MRPDAFIASRLGRAARSAEAIMRFVDSPLGRRAEDPQVANFLFGNPQDLPLPGVTAALQRWAVPEHKDWFAYTTHHRPAQEAVAASLRSRYDLPFEAADVLPTTGAFGGLSLLLSALTDPGDEVIFLSPPWFFYEAMIHTVDARPVRVRLDPPVFDLDPGAIARAITPRTRALILNSAHNPSGRVYGPDVLAELARVLEAASAANGRPIFLLSDEAYSHLVFDGRTFHTPTAFYQDSFLIYTYGKVLLAPGQRLGYVALAPAMTGRESLRRLLFTSQIVQGWTFPNALMQYALPDLEAESIDVAHLQVKRDRLVTALRDAGYEVRVPESTFYLLPKSPIADDWAFCERLAGFDVLCLPGSAFELPGYFRISITANDQMIDRALAGFRAAVL